MKLCLFAVASALTLTDCTNDPNYQSGFTNGAKNRKGERVEETEASKPTPAPNNPLNRPVDAAGQPTGS